jgi:hypothetical protein
MPLNDTPSLRARFWSNVDKSGDCWIWTASKQTAGYGQFRRRGAHRVVWEFTFGPIPAGMFVCHRCDVRTCVNPDHLFLGSHKDNMLDMAQKGRAARGDKNGARLHPETHARGDRSGARLHPERLKYGEDLPQAVLTKEAVRDIRRRYAAGGISQPMLAREYGVHQSTIWKVIHGLWWKHVEDAD